MQTQFLQPRKFFLDLPKRKPILIYLCLYDLEKAFDTIEHATLLTHIYKRGVNGKCWRLIKIWYQHAESVVKCHGEVSQPFSINRGVRQGSVLSPTLFLVVMDSLLQELQRGGGGGLSIYGLSIGAAAHADDIRCVSNSVEGLQKQFSVIQTFSKDNAIRINLAKTEVVRFSAQQCTTEDIELGDQPLAVRPAAKCLGYWWHSTFSPAKSIDENIAKARRAYFALGSIGAFQGQLNPLSGRSLFSTFVTPILLYGCENWILSESLLVKLEKFQAEIGRRILCLSKHHADLSTLLGLHWPRIRVLVLLRKMAFVGRLLKSDKEDQSSRVFRTLACDDIVKISLVDQCKLLESEYGTSYTEQCLNNPDKTDVFLAEAKKILVQKDWNKVLDMARSHRSLQHISEPVIVST